MRPKAHMDNPPTSGGEEVDYLRLNAAGFVILIIISILVAPLLHEMLHMFFLDVTETQYKSEIVFSLASGIHGKLTPFAELGVGDSIILLGVGVLSNLVLSAVFFLGSWITRHRGMTHESILSTYLAVGFFYNPLMYFFAGSGDLVNIMSLLDLEGYSYVLPITGLSMLIFVLLYVHDHAKNVLWGQEGVEREPLLTLDFL
jgi:hypothetical protein